MKIPYRTRQLLKGIAITLLILALIGLVIWGLWILWLSRFVVYTRDEGARLDFSLSQEISEGELAVEPESVPTIGIYYNEGEDAITANQPLAQLNGYYITQQVLETENFDTILSQVEALPKGTPVMVDVKSIKGSFFYASSVSTQRNSAIDTEAMEQLITRMNEKGLYLIARLPALRDFYYGLDHVPDGLPTSGGYLWMDDASCYWLNPASEGTRNYLVQQIQELRSKGFDEVVLTDFYFPATDQIVFSGDKAQTLTETAQLLVDACCSDSFALSFVKAGDYTLPTGRTRVYLEGVEAGDADQAAQDSGVADTAVNLVFLAQSHDTRYDTYGVLRPLASAH